ncbi:hypothetical protein [Pseudomonas sp. MBLB4136]|uniref:hypothetical protein n=1 Tax=Pseudomonas sp. MBLB4136 TaxID=3451558 RepID=UPI003F74BB52
MDVTAEKILSYVERRELYDRLMNSFALNLCNETAMKPWQPTTQQHPEIGMGELATSPLVAECRAALVRMHREGRLSGRANGT